MGDICRLCCSTKFVNHYIFDEQSSVYLKMSLYLPIKVVKNDRLPQKICDDCCCKIDEFYQFYNRTIEVQHRLRLVYATVLPLDDSVDLTVVKQNSYSPPHIPSLYHDQSTQTESFTNTSTKDNDNCSSKQVKLEPISKSPSPVKIENITDDFHDDYTPDVPSDNSEDTLLINLKRPKKGKKVKDETKNGDVKENKRGRKSKGKTKDWQDLVPKKLLTDNMVLSEGCEGVKEEVLDMGGLGAVLGGLRAVKEEVTDGDIHFCCICFTRCTSKSEMLQHYKSHGNKSEPLEEPPAPPPLPERAPLRCHRCQKLLEAGEWGAHWRRHWERDRRPFRCALCEKTFRDHHQILKHGLTHKSGADGGAGGAGGAGGEGGAPVKRFVCDLCPESFVYMRCLLAHRTRAHPEAAARALALRCGQCARQFAHLNSLRRHLRAHSGERNFLCSVCGKALSSREHLKFHLRIHTGYKPHVCKTCGKGFVKKCNLTLHERVHSGEKPHVCAHCGKAFSQRSTLVIHERYHSGARPYSCALCGRGFVAKGLLSMHLKTTCVDGRPPPPPPPPRSLPLELIIAPDT